MGPWEGGYHKVPWDVDQPSTESPSALRMVPLEGPLGNPGVGDRAVTDNPALSIPGKPVLQGNESTLPPLRSEQLLHLTADLADMFSKHQFLHSLSKHIYSEGRNNCLLPTDVCSPSG